MATVKHFSEVVAKATTAEPHTNPTEIGRIEYYVNGNKLGYALSGCIAQSRSILNSEYMINRNDCKWRAKVDDEGPYEDMSDEEIEFQKQTGKYPFFLPARERCAWRNSE